MIFTVIKLRFNDYVTLPPAILLIVLIILLPQICAEGASRGLVTSAKVLIPSLFPFAVPILYLTASGVILRARRPVLIVYLLSLIGGYPIGAKLLSELQKSGVISRHEGEKYLPFCVNAGPAFIVIAIGKGIIGSVKVGYILLAAHCLASLIIALVFSPTIITGRCEIKENLKPTKNSFAESLKNASGTCLNISAFVVFFSVINAYLIYFSDKIPQIKYLIFITEITSATASTKNIYFISFLLGFAGISIWMQVFSLAGKLYPAHFKFIVVRLLHGSFSALISMFLFRIFKVHIAVISNGKAFTGKLFFNNFMLSISLAVMILLFLINITAKKHSGNFLKDML